MASVPAAESRRVRARDQEPPRSRRRRDRVSPGRHDQRRLRQRRRRADVLADVDGRLPARRQPHRDAGDRRSGRLGGAGDVQAAEDRVADGAGRGRAAGNARRHLGRSHLRRRRRLRLQHGLLRRTARLPVRQHAAGRGNRGVARRRAPGDLPDRSAHERGEDRPDASRRAPMHVKAGTHRVTAAFIQRFEGLDQRPDRADRSHDGRHRDRHRPRHHHAAAPAQPQHHRSASRHRRERYAEPPPRLLVPGAVAGRRNTVRVGHRPAPGDAGVPPSGCGEGSRAVDDVLRARPQGEELRGRHHQGARSDPRQPAVPVPRRRDSLPRRSSQSEGGTQPIASATTNWPRACRFSCGDAGPMPSC